MSLNKQLLTRKYHQQRIDVDFYVPTCTTCLAVSPTNPYHHVHLSYEKQCRVQPLLKTGGGISLPAWCLQGILTNLWEVGVV